VYVGASLPGRLASLPQARGQKVTRGATLFTLEADNERAVREEAAARASGARALEANLGSGRRADEVAVTQAQLVQAQTQAALAASELARQQQLVAQGFITAARLDDARATARQSQAHVDELTAQLRVARLPGRADERAAALASAQAAEQVLAQARWREAQMQPRAASDAVVNDTFYRVGEWVGAGQPVLALLPPGAVKLRFFVPQPALQSLRIGQAVTVQCDGCTTPLSARIDFIASQAEYTPPVIYSNSQRSRLVFMVEARPEAAAALALKPGQPIDVRPAPQPLPNP
jgi:HlyD family secretion protein